MRVEFQYAYVWDLVYHMLAHIKVDNPSDLYAEEYIERIRLEKKEQFPDIVEAMANLSGYYNENFNRLGIINFLPFGCPDINALKYVLEQYPGFMPEDREFFVNPFVELLEKEDAFYGDYWRTLFQHAKEKEFQIEDYLERSLEKYGVLGDYFHKSTAVVGLSFSMTCAGRGLMGNPDAFVTIIPYSQEEEDYSNLFLQVLHENTHQFTDALLQQNICMDDGSHLFSEYIVILFDYYLIKAICPEDLESYLCYLSSALEMEEEKMTEELLLNSFVVPEDWSAKLQQLVQDICLLK